MMGSLDFHLDTIHCLTPLHRQLHLVSVHRAEDERQPEWMEHSRTGEQRWTPGDSQ